MEILGADFFDWLCDGSDVNEAFKLDEVADLNLPSDLPTTSGQHTGNKRMFATYNFHSCANVTFNKQYGLTCTSN